MELKVIDNKVRNRFELVLDGSIAFIEYKRKGEVIYLTHTEVPKVLEGKGVASAMVQQVFEHIQSEGLKLVALCPFISAYLKRHPEWNELQKT